MTAMKVHSVLEPVRWRSNEGIAVDFHDAWAGGPPMTIGPHAV
jgi:hypothetical protein